MWTYVIYSSIYFFKSYFPSCFQHISHGHPLALFFPWPMWWLLWPPYLIHSLASFMWHAKHKGQHFYNNWPQSTMPLNPSVSVHLVRLAQLIQCSYQFNTICSLHFLSTGICNILYYRKEKIDSESLFDHSHVSDKALSFSTPCYP